MSAAAGPSSSWGKKRRPKQARMPAYPGISVCLLFLFTSFLFTNNPIARQIEDKLKPFDNPAQAREFYRLKRAPGGKGPVPVDRYFKAVEHVKQMPVYSTRLNKFVADANGINGPVLGQWTNLGPGNVGGRTRALLVNPASPNTMYAGGVAGGIWKTTNSGASWTTIADLLPNIAVNSMAMDSTNSNVIYAGTGEGYFNEDSVRGAGIFKTTDAGATWTNLASTNNSDFYYVNDVVVSPNNNQRIYAGTGTGVWRSTNGGTSWTHLLDPGVLGGCLDLVIRTDQSTDYLFASCGTFDSFSFSAVYRNTNAAGAGTWTQVLTEFGMGRTSLALAPSNQAVVYALASSLEGGAYDQGLYAVFRSTNGGTTWTARVRNTDPIKLNTVLLSNPIIAFFTECTGEIEALVNQGWYDNVIAVDPLDPNRVWVGGIDLFRSDDGGANWGLASHWWADPTDSVYCHADQHVIVFHPGFNGMTNKTMYVGNDGGLFVTTDARAGTGNDESAVCNKISSVPWANLNGNYGVTQFYHGVPYPDGTAYFGGSQDNGVIKGTNVAGPNSWSALLGGDGGYVAVDASNTNVLYVENIYLSIQKSTDGGATFVDVTTGIGEFFLDFGFITPFVMDASNSQRLWTGGLFMWRTADGAANWSQASDIVAGFASISAIAVAPTNPNNVLAGTQDGLIHRTNIGLTSDENTAWPFAQPREGFVSSLTFDPANANVAYATYSSFNNVAADRHVYKSTDAGATWEGIDGSGSTGIPDIPVHSLLVDPANSSRLYIGTDIGVFVSLDGGTNWARENTGFANVATYALAVNGPVGARNVFAFTHGRGAWRVPVCAFALNKAEVFVPAGGGTASINISTPSGCDWTANTAESWITIVSSDNGSGNGSLDFEFRENFTGSARLGMVSVAGQSVTVVQDGGLGDDCEYGINPTFNSLPSSGGSGSFSVLAAERCGWQAVSGSAWITITSGGVGIGNGTVSYSVAPNSGAGRKGTITVAGKTFSIKQKGA